MPDVHAMLGLLSEDTVMVADFVMLLWIAYEIASRINIAL